MDQIAHKYIEVDGLKLHVAEIGSSGSSAPAVVFLYGFPEIWYSWRYQMIAVAKAGFRAIAPDYRGYGLSNPPPETEKATFADLLSDLAAILDALGISKVFLIGKGFGAIAAYPFALRHPKKVSGIVTLGMPFLPDTLVPFMKNLPEGFYISRFGEPGRAEADFGRFDAKTVVRKLYIHLSRSELPTAEEKQEIMDVVKPSDPLPPWFTEEDLSYYGALYEKSGFRTAMQVPYGSIDEDLDIADPKFEGPALLIMGEKDYMINFTGMEDYIRSGQLKTFVPNVEITFVPEGGHFINEQFPDKVNQLIIDFLHKHN